MTSPASPFSPDSPAALGYRMPPEWAPHAATWFSWPQNPDTWGRHLPSVESALAKAVAALREGEAVHLNVLDEDHAGHVRRVLARYERDDHPHPVHLHAVPTDDAWCRDHGAVFVTRPEADEPLAALDFEFNAWGGKYPPYDRDNRVAREMAAIAEARLFRPRIGGKGIVLEGGSIEVNGVGAVLTTERCLLNPNRNPGLSKTEIETVLRDTLGVHTVLWTDAELAGDDTDAHIDNLARFVGEDAVLTVVEDDASDANYPSLQENLHRLQAMRLADGRPLRIEALPTPKPLVVDGVRLPASYANFYVGNRVVLVPIFQDPADDQAVEIVGRHFPGRRVVPIDARAVVWGLGAFHCLSQQVPAV